MPRIPTITAEKDIYTGPAPQGSFMAFSGGAQGMEDVGQAMVSTGATLGQIAKHKQQTDDNRWVQKAAAQYQEEAINFLHNPENKNREDYETIATQFLKDQQAKYAQNAPSGRSNRLFGEYASRFYNSNLPAIKNRTEAVKLEKATGEIEVNVNKALGAFRREAAAGDAASAALNAEAQRELQHAMLKDTYGTLSPAAERRFREIIDKSYVMGVAEHNPEYARRVLESSEHIDESARKTLLSHIEQVEQRGLRMARYEFERELDRAVETGFSNEVAIAPVSKGSFIRLYGKEDGELAYKRFEDQRTESNTAIAVAGGMRGKNAAAIARQANEFEKTPASRSLKNLVARKADELIRYQAQDPAGYLAANNDEVHSAFSAFSSAPPQEQARAFQKYADLVRKYQGKAAGATDGDRYMDLPTGDRHILPKPMALDWAGRINHGGYDEKLQTLQQFGALFESYDAWNVGFNDLVKLPEGQGVKPEIQLALQFARWKDGQVYFDQPETVRGYLEAATDVELLKEIGKDNEKYADYSNALDAHPKWKEWVRAVGNDRAEQVAAYKNGMVAYAWKHGRTATEGARKAVDDLIVQHTHIGTVNGTALPMAKVRKDGTPRTEVELEDISRRMGVSLKYLDVDQIDTSRLRFLPTQLGEGKEKRLHLLRYVMNEGFFRPEPDGNSATLHVMSDGGRATQLTDKQGQPFRIHYDNLPAFTGTRTERVARIGPRGVVITGDTKQVPVPETPSKTVDDKDYAAPTWQDDEFTHWPVRPWTIKQSEWGEFKKTFMDMMQKPPTDPDLPFQMMRDLYR